MITAIAISRSCPRASKAGYSANFPWRAAPRPTDPSTLTALAGGRQFVAAPACGVLRAAAKNETGTNDKLSRPVITASGLIRFFHLASTALLFGSLAFYFLVSRPALASAGGLESPEFAAFDGRQRRAARWALLLVFLSGLLAFWLQIVAVSGLSFAAALNPTVMAGVLIGTRYGLVWSMRMILLLFLEVIFNRLDRSESTNWRAAGLIFAALLVMAPVFSGHAAAGEGLWLAVQLAVAAAHLLAASTWLGGLVFFAWFLLWLSRVVPAWNEAVFKAATRRFSALGFVSVTILLATGAYNAWTLVGAVPPLLGTSYGQLLLIKLAMIVPLIALAAVNLFKLKPRILASGVAQAAANIAELLHRLRRNVTRRGDFRRRYFNRCRHDERHAAGAPCPAGVAVCVSLELEHHWRKREAPRANERRQVARGRRRYRFHLRIYAAAPATLSFAGRQFGDTRLRRLDLSHGDFHRRLPDHLSSSLGSLQRYFRRQW